MVPLRPLLSTKNEFSWSEHHAQAFSKVKEQMVTSPVLAFFDITKPMRLCTDTSMQGLGFILQQQSMTGKWTLVQADSRFCQVQNLGIATIIELELFAVA